VSSISSGRLSQSEIWVFDCVVASSHISPTKRAATAQVSSFPRRLWYVSFNTKLKPTNSMIITITISITHSMIFCDGAEAG